MSARIARFEEPTIARAVDLLRAGRLVAFATETVYGLGADARNPQAVRRIFEAKGRPADHPVIVHVGTGAECATWAARMPATAEALAQAFWPGPLTLIVPRAAGVHGVVTGGQDSIGLRMPSHPVARALLLAFGGGIAAPSANRFGRISPTAARHVAEDLGSDVDLIIDGGSCAVGIESTIVSCLDDDAVLLRPGAVGVDSIAQVLGRRPALPGNDAPRASGTLPSHYAPQLPTRLVDAGALARSVMHESSIAVLARTVPKPTGFRGTWIAAPNDAPAYAHDLYGNLRTLDQSGARALWIEGVPEDEAWRAVSDRLMRASAGHTAALDNAE